MRIVEGRQYRIKRGLPTECWFEIGLGKADWEGKTVTVYRTHHAKTMLRPNMKRGFTTRWWVNRAEFWFPDYAFEASCMFAR